MRLHYCQQADRGRVEYLHPLYWILIYPDKWREGKLLARLEGKCLLGELRGEHEADRIRVSQQFTPAGARETKDPIFHSAAAHPCHLTSAIKRTAVPCRRQILQSCALVLPRVIVPPLRSCISLERLLCARKLGMHVSRHNDGQCDHSHLSPHSCTATCRMHLHGLCRN